MDEEEQILDAEYNRFLQIMKPYLDLLLNEEAIEICNAWIQRLSKCTQNEKSLRNKYIFALCYQLSKGVLEEPFVYKPNASELPSLPYQIPNDESFSEIEYVNMDLDDARIIYKNNLNSVSTADNSFGESVVTVQSKQEIGTHIDRSITIDRNNLPDQNIPSNLKTSLGQDKAYQSKITNLIIKLRDIKRENLRLHEELYTLKEETKIRHAFENSCEEILKIDTSTSAYFQTQDSSTTLQSLKCRLKEVQESRNLLIDTISNVKNKLDNYDDMKKYEIDDIKAKHKLQIIQIEIDLREEMKKNYEKELEELKIKYESVNSTQQSKLEEIENVTANKDEIISQKDTIIELKNSEITQLKSHIEDLKSSQAKEKLEKCLNKLEKSKVKYCRAYESKIANMKREKHLAECALHLQLVKQRTQVINEVVDDHQVEISTALDKLENKYKEIVASVQATAVQRRIYDQMSLESVIKTVCQTDNVSRNSQRQTNKVLHSQVNCDIEYPTLAQSNRVGSVVVGNCTEGVKNSCDDNEKMRELFEKSHIPQRDLGGA